MIEAHNSSFQMLPDSRVEGVPDMTFSSSPVQYPPSSLPALAPAAKQKRKLFQTLQAQQPSPKKPRLETIELDLSALPKSPKAISIDAENELRPGFTSHELDTATPENIEDVLTFDASDPVVPRRQHLITHSAPVSFGRGLKKRTIDLQTCSGQTLHLAPRKRQPLQIYEQIIADRSSTIEGKAKRSYYGIEIHQLIDDAKLQRELDEAAREAEAQKRPLPSIERPQSGHNSGSKKSERYLMWTEKYRAKKFTELVGDERTHRSVLRWLKAWDTIVFPGAAKKKPKKVYEDKDAIREHDHRKILLLTGPPGLGKTTLAHVCARQAGYEVLEINASDDRSKDVVKGRIKDALATETVRGIQEPGRTRKAGRPVCVVVDEVDGVVSGSGGNGGEGGFMRALIDLVQLDQRNTTQSGTQDTTKGGKKKGDRFKLLRPLILICNDVYAPSLRPLRQSSIAEIVHVRKPPLDKVITRMKTVFETESIRCDNDAIRRLCEDCWGLGTRKQSSRGSRGTGDGDIRGVLVQGEWMAHKLRLHDEDSEIRLTRKWVEAQIAGTSRGPKGIGRGGTREVVERIFLDGAGLPDLPTTLSADEQRQFQQSKANPIGVADLRKRSAITALREMIDTTGDHDRLMTDCFAAYGSQVYQDDTFLSKPNMSYDWLFFHDSLSSRIHRGQEWELNPYLSTSACAFHNLFSGMDKGGTSWGHDKDKEENEEQVHPLSGLKADYAAYETEKANRTVLNEMQSNFPGEMLRLFSSTDTIATELVPNVARILSPDVKPVVVGGSGGSAAIASVRKESEKNCVKSSVRVMNALNITFEKLRIDTEGYGSGGYTLRMEPYVGTCPLAAQLLTCDSPIDTLSLYHFSTSKTKTTSITNQPTRYAIRQVLDQELRKEKLLQASLSRQARGQGLINSSHVDFRVSIEDDTERKNLDPKSNSHRPVAKPTKIRRDFFGRPIATYLPTPPPEAVTIGNVDASIIVQALATNGKAKREIGAENEESERIWMSFNQGFSNAVRKPITLSDLLEGF